ncbi:MAG: extracellular solute-binding protein [Spirochaetaceae bacterium]|jgi:ABC-type glycerol-3-phosphate transport system substrate-binding protein|nr:extracellular solute-binding protein [Spirochaetaceae bacterium]
MVYKKSRFTRFDKVLVITAAVVLVIALVFLPKESFRLMVTTVKFTQAWSHILKNGELNALIAEFKESNPTVNVKLDNDGDVIAVETPQADAVEIELEDRTEIMSFINPLFYNIDLLQSCGLDRPPKTLDEFVAACHTVQKTYPGIRGIVFSSAVYQDITPWFWAAGIKPQYDGEQSIEKIDWTSRSALVILSFLQKLGEEHLVAEASFVKSREEKLRAFTKKKCAFFIGSAGDIKLIREMNKTLNFSVSTIPVPANYNGKSIFNVSSWNVGIAPESDHKAQALSFVEFLMKKRSALAAAAGAMPGDSAVTTTNSPEDEIERKARILYENSDIVRDYKLFSNLEKTAAVFKTEIAKMWRGEQDAQQTAEALNLATGTP